MPVPGNFANNRSWFALQELKPESFVCGYCGLNVSSERGYKIIVSGHQNSQHGGVFICPACQAPTYFPPDEKRQIPGVAFGNHVAHVPSSLESLYEEARNCTANADYTASVLVCRKMLMNIAVQQGASENLK